MAGKLKQKVDNIVEKASHAFLVLSGILIVIMMFSATYGVVRRKLFFSPEPYSYELSMVGMLWSFVLAVAALERQRRHIRVDFVSGRLPLKAQGILLNIAAPILGLFIFLIISSMEKSSLLISIIAAHYCDYMVGIYFHRPVV